jgi:hypothetical protein
MDPPDNLPGKSSGFPPMRVNTHPPVDYLFFKDNAVSQEH